MNKCKSSVQEYLSVLNKRKSIFKWNLNIFLRGWSLSFESVKTKCNLLRKLSPNVVLFTELFVVHVTFLSQNLQDMLWFERSKSMIKESRLLCGEPSSQIIVSAIRKSTNKMTNIIVFSCIIQFFHSNSTENLFIWVKDTLHVKFMLS